jgi:hypothetical protein
MRAKRTSIGVLICALLCTTSFNVSRASADEAVANKPVFVDVFNSGKMEVPAEFKQVPPKSRIVQHEFQASVGDGEKKETARVTMMVSGGGVKANVRRWKGQFAGGDKQANKTEELKVGQWTVHIVDLNGSFGERMGGGPVAGGKVVQRENYSMCGAIIIAPDAKPDGPAYFVKMIGPATVIKANRERMVAMVKSLDK